jgi:hypothetical protein
MAAAIVTATADTVMAVAMMARRLGRQLTATAATIMIGGEEDTVRQQSDTPIEPVLQLAVG